jgi:hypothetical protein
MTMRLRVTGLLVTAAFILPAGLQADTTPAPTHRAHKAKKEQLPPPLPSGTRGPVPQVPLDAIPPIAPQVSYQDGLLTIVAPNSTLGDILRSVRKHTSADIEIPPTASERVVTHLGPAPAREVMAELLNGSHFNYILLGSPENANELVKVVLVARTAEAAAPPPADGSAPAAAAPVEAPEIEATDENTDDTAEQAQEPEPQAPAEQAKTPQQLLQEMQQRQLQLQQQQQTGQPGLPGQYPPGMGNPRIQPQQNQDQQ